MFDASTRIAAPIVTPFDDGDVDHDALATLVDHLADAGVDGLVPCGTTGEFSSLTPAEQRRVVATTVSAAPDGVPVVAGASGTAVGDVRARIDAAADAGADGVLTLPPYYLTAEDPAGNEEFLADALADSPLPAYLYNIPSVVGTSIDPETVAALADLDGVVGLKDSSGDGAYVSSVLNATPEDFQVFCGFDALLVPGVFLGVDGGISALANLIPEVLVDAVDALRSGDHGSARRLHRDTITPLFDTCLEFGFAPAMKEGLAARDVIDSPEVRAPLTRPDEADRAAIRAAVDDLSGD